MQCVSSILLLRVEVERVYLQFSSFIQWFSKVSTFILRACEMFSGREKKKTKSETQCFYFSGFSLKLQMNIEKT